MIPIAHDDSSALVAMQPAHIVRDFLLDVILWYCIPAAFLIAYVGHYGKPFTAIAPHLRLLTLPLAGLLLARLIIGRLGIAAGPARVMATFATGTLLTLLIAYYILVLVGLASWGGVVAWNVIPTFFAQIPILADGLGISPRVPPLIALLIYAGILYGCWAYFARRDWTLHFARRVSGSVLALLLLCGASALAVESYRFSWGAGTVTGEPVSLTVFPPSGSMDLEGYSVNPVTATRMARIDSTARATYSPVASTGHANVIVIVVDALRPDHMGIYGYSRATTPNLARIALEQPTLVVNGTHSSCGDTVCSLYSLFSSRFPREFSTEPFTLQEALRRNGYRIHLVLSGDHTYFHSLKQIYGPVDTFYDGTQARNYFLNDDRLVVDRVARMPDWDGIPVMFQFHLMSAHILRRNDVVPGRFQPAQRYVLKQGPDTGADGQALATAVNFYDNGVVSADSIINSLLVTLQAKGYLRNALVVITADHGESLGEHGLFHHANSVREELLRIPLVLIAYGLQPHWPAQTRQLPSEVDIAPTILAQIGLPLPQSWSGRPLQQADGGSEFSYFDEQRFAGLIDHRDPANQWKYWIDTRSGEDHVFNLSHDPHEQHEARKAVPAAQLYDWRNRTLAVTSVALGER